jgi:Ras-related protein Rab-1A
VKAIEKQVKLKVTLFDSGDTITVSEEQIVSVSPLRIGNTVTVRLTSSNRRQSNDSNSHHQHYSRSGLAAFINQTNPDEKQATIKQIIDNSIYTVVFNDGDEKSLRRSSLCLQGVRLYQTQYGQPKILEEIPTSPPPSLPTTSETSNTNANDASSIVAVKRPGNSDAFPAYVLKRKALADYMWVRSFVDGREYIVNTRDDVQPYQNNSEIQALCRSTSKPATQACEKFIKYNQIPAVWQKKKKKQSKSDNKNAQSDAENSSSNESSSSESDDEDDDDEIDEETTEEKDSFVAQLFAFMDDRGTPINNIPKVQNYDLDLHRLFKIVRLFGGFNKVTKNDQWDKVHIKMGLPDEVSGENGRSIENAYKK